MPPRPWRVPAPACTVPTATTIPPVPNAPTSVQFERSFHGRPEELRQAFLEAERLARWLRPAKFGAPSRVAGEARVGGGCVLEFSPPGMPPLVLETRIRELGERRLVMQLSRRHGSEHHDWPLTVELRADNGATLLRLTQEGVHDDEREQVESTWRHSLTRIAGECTGMVEDFYRRQQAWPRFRSRFGGLWPDLSDAEARIAGKQELGVLDEADAARFRHWCQHGYVTLERTVEPALIDRLQAEVEEFWQQGRPDLTLEVNDDGTVFRPMAARYRHLPHKVLDLHGASPIARDIVFSPAIRRFLGLLFERPPMVFQSLMFQWGTEQAMHQDTAYVVTCSPMEFVGCWIALQDVQPGSGELQYYAGSHRLPEFLWFDRARSRPPEYEDDHAFLSHVREESERAGCELRRFRPRKGDALIWHADLVHGGAPRMQRDLTRWSLVSHLCPVDVDPEWMGRLRHSGRQQHAPGCYYSFPIR